MISMLNTKLNRNSILFVNLNNLKYWNPRSALIIWGSVQNKTNVVAIDKIMFYVQTYSEFLMGGGGTSKLSVPEGAKTAHLMQN